MILNKIFKSYKFYTKKGERCAFIGQFITPDDFILHRIRCSVGDKHNKPDQFSKRVANDLYVLRFNTLTTAEAETLIKKGDMIILDKDFWEGKEKNFKAVIDYLCDTHYVKVQSFGESLETYLVGAKGAKLLSVEPIELIDLDEEELSENRSKSCCNGNCTCIKSSVVNLA